MEGPLDKFVKKRKTSDLPDKEVKEEKDKKKEEKSPIKQKKTQPMEVEKDAKESADKIIIEDDKLSKFYPTYESFIDKLESWKVPLKLFINPPNNSTMKSIYNFVKKEYSSKTIFPPKNLIFNAFSKTPWDKVKVVIIGQDPYPNPGDAMGLSFSVPKTQNVPGSLRNIYKCLEKDQKIKFIRPKHGDLVSWAEQGVFLLWGNFAINKSSLIDTKKHLIIKNIHPSPLAQSKGDFTNSQQFSQTNEYLIKNGIEPINWQIQ